MRLSLPVTLASSCCVALVAIAAPRPALAHVRAYYVKLSAAEELPPGSTSGVGVGFLTLDLDIFTMRLELEFSGLIGSVTDAHVHGNTSEPGEGLADIITPLPTLPGFPSGEFAGTYDGTLDLAEPSSYNPDFITASGGTISNASNRLFSGLDHGQVYLDIHTSEFVDGELRGFLLPLQAADFTHDALVDADDLLEWEESFGTGHRGDANGDNMTDGQDLLIWQRQVGTVPTLPEPHHHDHTAAIPEPESAHLLGAAIVVIGIWRIDGSNSGRDVISLRPIRRKI